DGQSAVLASGFSYAASPTVSSVSPNSGPASGGTTISIAGTNFVSGATVKVGGVAATGVSVVSATQVSAVAPAHAAGAVAVTVTNPDTQASSLSGGFTYNAAPSITAVSPNNGAQGGGTSVSITGASFAPGAMVLFDSATATAATVVSGTSITALAP